MADECSKCRPTMRNGHEATDDAGADGEGGRGDGRRRRGRPGGTRAAPAAGTIPGQVAALARVQPPGDVPGPSGPAVPRAGFRRDRRAWLRLRATPARLSLLDRPSGLGEAPGGAPPVDRPGRRVRTEAWCPRPTEFPPRPGVHGGATTRTEVALDRPRGPGRLRAALGAVRPALSGHPQPRGQLQPAQ